MHFERLKLALSALPGALPGWRAITEAGRLREVCAATAAEGARLAALWGSDERDAGAGFRLQAVLTDGDGLLWLQVPLAADNPVYPDLSDIFPCAGRMQRAAFDLLGMRANAEDQRKWLRHGAWRGDEFPLRRDFTASSLAAPERDGYPFVQVEGDGVHEIPVGPVHAGIIEPGHFRFSVVGEETLRLEQRLGYKHKGIEKRFEGMSIAEGAKLAGRVSGDSTATYAWAYAMAVESMTDVTPPPRALWLRALMLERERIANHLGDLGALGNDGGFAIGLAHFMRLKETVLRLNARLFGHRLQMDLIVPGGVACDVDRDGLALLTGQCDQIEGEVRAMKNIYDEHAGLQDRFLSCGVLKPEIAARLGVSGFAARASNQGFDVRSRPGFAPYDLLDLRVAARQRGDVAARVLVRFDELFESLRLIRAVAERISPGDILKPCPEPRAGNAGIGWVEGWRGDVLVALESGAAGRIRRCHAHDPSWQNWPALEHAVIGNIVPDFPLINKSFNLSYSGQDL
jgi:Ni,Fe-hydrogenase III large subunit/Ni,Fe-hydrogenase III component G